MKPSGSAGSESPIETARPVATLIVLSQDQKSFYEFLKPRQEGRGAYRVILDERTGDRRKGRGKAPTPDRRKAERRAPTPDAARALMSVLGFAVLNPAEQPAQQAQRTSGSPSIRKPGNPVAPASAGDARETGGMSEPRRAAS